MQLRWLLFLLQIPSALMVLYLDVLAAAAWAWRGAPPRSATHKRFALLIPAHNEEMLLPRLLQSVSLLDYPSDLYDTHVVADNCSDLTATVARVHGADVHERFDETLQGKGYALSWLIRRLKESNLRYDAYVILDADSTVSDNFLDVMNCHLGRGDQAVQSYYGVLNSEASWSTALRQAALALFNCLRPRGRDALGLSAGLRGNGMCFTSQLLEHIGWDAFTLAEDVEYHLRLVDAGIRVRYAGTAWVLAEMPTSLHQAESQNVRWERGRLQMLRTVGWRSLVDSVRTRNLVRLDAVAEQLVPPLSVLTAVTGTVFVTTTALSARGPRRLASLLLFGTAAYTITGLRLIRADKKIYLALLGTPLYIVWKIWIYGTALIGIADNRWVRTARSPRDRKTEIRRNKD